MRKRERERGEKERKTFNDSIDEEVAEEEEISILHPHTIAGITHLLQLP